PGRGGHRRRISALEPVDPGTHVVGHRRRAQANDCELPVDVLDDVLGSHARADPRGRLVGDPAFCRLDGHGNSFFPIVHHGLCLRRGYNPSWTMSSKSSELPAGDHIFLAFLLWGPASAYDIKKTMTISVSNFWSAAHSQVYQQATRLLRDGY